MNAIFLIFVVALLGCSNNEGNRETLTIWSHKELLKKSIYPDFLLSQLAAWNFHSNRPEVISIVEKNKMTGPLIVVEYGSIESNSYSCLIISKNSKSKYRVRSLTSKPVIDAEYEGSFDDLNQKIFGLQTDWRVRDGVLTLVTSIQKGIPLHMNYFYGNGEFLKWVIQ